MTALFASVCMMYNPMRLPLPKMLWKMPACETVTKLSQSHVDGVAVP